MVAVAEHWLHDNRLALLGYISSEICYHGRSSNYAKAENYGTKRGQGGVALIWKSNMSGVTEISNIIHDPICGIRVATKNGGILNIFSVYLPAQGGGEELQPCLDDLAEVIDSREQGSINVICGDFNADMGRKGGTRSKRCATKQGSALFKLISEFGLSACNLGTKATGPIDTHVVPTGKSTVDYILVPQGIVDKVQSCQVYGYDALNTSDHFPIQIVLNIENFICDQPPKGAARFIRWDKLDADQLQIRYATPLYDSTRGLVNKLGQVDLEAADLDACIDNFTESMIKASRSIPTSKFRKHIKPFWNDTLDGMKKAKISSYRRWVKGNRPREEGNALWVAYKQDERAFSRELKRVSKGYVNEQVEEAIKAAEVDRGHFWRLVKRSRGGSSGRIASIKDANGKVVSDTDSILDVWKCHFEKLYTPKHSEKFDQAHFEMVSQKVKELNEDVNNGRFLQQTFEESEVKDANKCLHKRKACGFDGISTEHLVYGGHCVVEILTLIYNHVARLEYIPTNLKRGIRIPLFKGKGACCLDPDNYRGISLLTNLNKVYEVLVWSRIKDWWYEQKVISDLQGAGKKKQSCVHSALLLQESVACALDTNRRVFVTFLDVSKAYDTVWIDGLFYKLHKMGIDGKLWRLMYRAYQGFMSKVRIGDKTSEWFSMGCGIHQGGFLSLTKYVAFINDLLCELEQSKLCCTIGVIPTTPVGYADDVATANTSTLKTD